MVYLDVVSISAAPRVDGVGYGDSSVCRCKDGSAFRRGDVGSAVVGNLPGERIFPIAKPLGDDVALRQGPLENAGPYPIGIGVHDLSAAADKTT